MGSPPKAIEVRGMTPPKARQQKTTLALETLDHDLHDTLSGVLNFAETT